MNHCDVLFDADQRADIVGRLSLSKLYTPRPRYRRPLGCPKKIKSLKCHAPQAFSGAEFHKDSENAIKNDLAQL